MIPIKGEEESIKEGGGINILNLLEVERPSRSRRDE